VCPKCGTKDFHLDLRPKSGPTKKEREAQAIAALESEFSEDESIEQINKNCESAKFCDVRNLTEGEPSPAPRKNGKVSFRVSKLGQKVVLILNPGMMESFLMLKECHK
jgi:predicted  nucleic acid-binding Zn-ribbon protein